MLFEGIDGILKILEHLLGGSSGLFGPCLFPKIKQLFSKILRFPPNQYFHTNDSGLFLNYLEYPGGSRVEYNWFWGARSCPPGPNVMTNIIFSGGKIESDKLLVQIEAE